MTRLSAPIESMKGHYTAVVVGSGYGAGVAASRIARAGQSVCLLERGREIRPGEYPNTELSGATEIQVNTPEGHLGSRLGMVEIHVNKGQNVLVGCGLGGTSLINANVALEPVKGVWGDPRWPQALIQDLDGAVADGYHRAREMLKPQPYPQDAPRLAKLDALEASATALGWQDQFYRPPINVTFEDGVNHVGVEQAACVGCGDCCSGCNYGAKNTTLMNYLPDAWNHGADIFTEVRVSHVSRGDGVWNVHYQLQGLDRDKFDAPELIVTADVVVLGAGTVGSTEILLRSKAKGLPLSDNVGHHFSGNGDVLGFGYNCDEPMNGIGFGDRKPDEMETVGPCITGIIDHRATDPVSEGFVIEEGSIPGAVGAAMPIAMATAAGLIGEDTDTGLWDRIKEGGRAVESIVRGPYHGAVHNTQTYLVMCHDGAHGTARLEHDRIRVDWPDVGSEPIFDTVNNTLAEATEPLGGTFLKNPIWTKWLDESLISVHPLGGCGMGEDAGSGVVNDRGQVFSGASGDAVHEGLYVADGAVMPMSLGVNPLLTISALAERSMAYLARARGWTIDYTLPSKPREPEAPKAMGLRFTETMRGYASTEVLDDYEAAAEAGKTADSAMEFTLTIISDDVKALIDQSQHQAGMVGTVSCAALSRAPMTVSQGRFNLFVKREQAVESRFMTYNMRLATEEGRDLYFSGYKRVDTSSVLEAWPQTTTLYITVHEGGDDSGPVVAKGILHIKPTDFLKQMTTMTVTNAPSETAKLKALAEFGEFFAGVMWKAYGGVFSEQAYFDPDAPPRKRRPLRLGAPEVHPFATGDGVNLLLTRYRGGPKGPVMLVHGCATSSEMFTTDLVDTNLVEYLYAHGYDVWLLDYRMSIKLPACEQRSDCDQVARYDIPAAVKLIRRLSGAESIQAMVHCYGSICFFMSMLQGLEGVRSVVASQVALHYEVPAWMAAKAHMHLPHLLDLLGVDSLTSYTDSHADWKDRLWNDLLKLPPAQGEDNDSRSPVDHRLRFLYGGVYQRDNLSGPLFRGLHEIFGVANIGSFEHLTELVRVGHAIFHDGAEIYMPHLDRLRLPIRFVHGALNGCWLPESTKLSYDLLCQTNGDDLYDRKLVDGYGHADCMFGKNAYRDVYPLIVEHLEETAHPGGQAEGAA